MRRSSLRRRLTSGTLIIVLVTATLIGVFSTIALRHSLMDRLDQQVQEASERSSNKRHANPDWTDGDAPAAPPTAQSSDDDTSSTKTPIPPGLDALGQGVGTLSLIELADGSTEGGYIDTSGDYQALTEAEKQALLDLPVTGKPVTVTISSLGDYRVLVSQEESTGSLIIIGLSMTDDNTLIRNQILAGSGIITLGALMAWIIGHSLLRSSLAPLERVSKTARKVAAMDLSSGEVTINERVRAADLRSSEEVGQVGGALNTLLDEVETALSARQRSEMQVRQFVADASHELRTPLASIRGYNELVQRETENTQLPEAAAHALGRVESESIRMTGLVEDLLLLARLDAGRELEHKEVNLVEIVLDTVSDARAASNDHNWLVDLPLLDNIEEDSLTPPPLVEGDDARLRQVLVNLLANARVHTPAGTTVTTTLRSEGDALVVTIADDGPGIPPELQEHLFERFTRGDASRERAAGANPSGSTGLGMSIALAVVQAHGGTLTVDSQVTQPSGTVFTVSLPALTGGN